MPDPKQEESFKVIDRRLFSADGEIRDEAVRDERHKQDAEPANSGTPAAKGSSGLSSPSAAAQSATPIATEPELPARPTAGPDTPKPSRGLEMLINFVAQNAAMLLGAYPDPRTGESMLDLEGARELVDMLDALRETTRGNLAPDDERLLVEVLSSLKLSFMEMTKAAAKAMKDKAQARS